MRKIGEIKGVPVVEGNVNEVTKNQIHYKEEEGGIQLSKRNNENKLNSITSGSSDSGGVKEYYYKYNRSEELDASQFVRNVVVIEVLYSNGEEVIPLNKTLTNYGVEDTLTTLIDRNCVAIKISDSRVNYITYDSNMPFMVLPKGSIVDKLLYLAKKGGFPEDQIEEQINLINSIFQEITKEEYESMITYRPE